MKISISKVNIKATAMSIKIGIGRLRIGTGGGGNPWSSYWSSQTPETDVTPTIPMAVMSDSFFGATIDTDKWDVTDPADGVTITQNNSLIFTINRASAVASTNTNPVDSKTSITSGFIEATLGGTITAVGSTRVFTLAGSITPGYQAQILGDTDNATVRVIINGSVVYALVSAIPFKNTWRISFDSTTNEVKFFYLNGVVWTQVGTTQVYDIDYGSGLVGRFGASSIAGAGTGTFTVKDFHMQNSGTVEVISDTLIVANDPGNPDTRWFGRPVLKRIADKIWIMVYANSEAHGELTYSQLHCKFSDDYGATWSDQNKYLDGSSVSGFPLYPVGATPGDNDHGPGEPWIVQCADSPNHLLVHMWDTDYVNYNNGTWQSESTDGGKTWSTPVKIDWVNNTGTANVDNRTYATDQTFVYNNVIYIGAREYEADGSFISSRSWFGKSTDNGQTWELISLLSAYSDKTNEYGMEYVGNNTIIACVRDFVGPESFYTKSTDMGLTWAALTEVQTLYEVWSRQRVKTRSHVKGTQTWWNDPLLIMHGFVHVSGEAGLSHPRRLAVWISVDNGDTFKGPYYLKEPGYDGGYGDFLYNPVTDEYVTLQYFAPTSLLDGEIRQINWKLTI